MDGRHCFMAFTTLTAFNVLHFLFRDVESRSGITLAICHRLIYLATYMISGLEREMSTPLMLYTFYLFNK